MGSRFSFFLFLAVFTAFIIRLVPTLVTNQPFSTDTWPLMKLSRVLLENPEYKIWDDSLLGGYHNRWPAVILEGALYATLTSLEPAYFFRFVGVIITQTSMLTTTYALIRKYRGGRAALLGALTLNSVPSLVILTSTTLKEVYAYPLALLFVLITSRSRDSFSALILASLVAVSLAASHPLTPLMMIAFLGSYVFVTWVRRLEGLFCSVSIRKYLVMFFLLSSIYVAYMILYGWEGLTLKLGLSDFLALSVIGVAVYGWYALVGRDFIKSLMILAPGITTILVTNYRFLEFPSVLLYAAPLVILLLPYVRGRGDRGDGATIAPILLPISVGAQYIVVASPLLITVLHRLLNYLFFAVIAVTTSLNTHHGRTIKYAVAALITSLIITALLSINLTLHDDPITYYWRYEDREVVGINNLVKYVSSEKVCGDVKIKYLISDSVAIDVLCGLRLPKTDSGYPTILYSDNLRFGYVLSTVDIYLIQKLNTLSLTRDLVYSNGAVYVVR